jgi:hypothetical protein
LFVYGYFLLSSLVTKNFTLKVDKLDPKFEFRPLAYIMQCPTHAVCSNRESQPSICDTTIMIKNPNFNNFIQHQITTEIYHRTI